MRKITTPAAIVMMVMTATMNSCGTIMTASAGNGIYDGGHDYYGIYSDGYQTGYDAGYNDATYHVAYEEARKQAVFLSDKMAYELGLTQEQYAAVYEINLDYIMSVGGEDDLYSTYWSRRNSDMFYVLSPSQYSIYMETEYFYRPLYWANNQYAYRIYTRYSDRNKFYFSRPSVYETYRGGNNRTSTSHYAGKFGQRKGNQPTTTTTRPKQTETSGNGTSTVNSRKLNTGQRQTSTTSKKTTSVKNTTTKRTTSTTVKTKPATTTKSSYGTNNGTQKKVTNISQKVTDTQQKTTTSQKVETQTKKNKGARR